MTSLSKWYVCTKSCGQLYIEMVFIAEICSSKWLRISSCVQSMREVTRVHTEALWVAPFWWIICLVGVICWPFLPRSEAFGGDLEDFKYAMSVLGMGWLLFLHWVIQSILATGLYIPLYDNMSQVFPYVFYSLITYRYCRIWSLPSEFDMISHNGIKFTWGVIIHSSIRYLSRCIINMIKQSIPKWLYLHIFHIIPMFINQYFSSYTVGLCSIERKNTWFAVQYIIDRFKSGLYWEWLAHTNSKISYMVLFYIV